jgi:hypothetical protein
MLLITGNKIAEGSKLPNKVLQADDHRGCSPLNTNTFGRGGARMIECLIKDQSDGFDAHVDVLERAMRPSVPHTVGSGRWTIDVGGDRFVDFSPEEAGLQVTFNDGIERSLAEHVAEDVVANLKSLTGGSFRIVWLS